MREIKFRALGERSVGLGREAHTEKLWKYFNAGEMCIARYKDSTLSQYTGLKDKNGVEIYEGDILHQLLGNNDRILEVQWDEELATFLNVERKKYDRAIDSFGVLDLRGDHSQNFEVIGNIHENADLLETPSGK